MKLFVIIALFLIVTTGLWGQTMAKKNAIHETGSHHVTKRTTKRAVPNTVCNTENEGRTHLVPANGSTIWICRSGEWKPFELLSSIGSSSKYPGKSCKHIKESHVNWCPPSGKYWIKLNVNGPCSEVEEATQIYCDMTTNGGGWHLVWKHSYLQVSPLNRDMFYNSSFYKPCTDLSVGWCNVPNKTRLQPEEMMIAAYHNGRLVYAYKGIFNRNIDHHWSGGTLLTPVNQIVDRCTRSGTGVPTPRQYDTLTGLVFDKQVNSHTDTLTGSLASPGDSRWVECYLPSGLSSSAAGVQMTMAIYVR